MTFTEEAKKYLLTFCRNSIRALLNNMEKIWILGNDSTIDLDTCIKICGIDTTQYEDYILHLKNGDLNGAIKIIYDVYDYGYSVIDIMESLFGYIKSTHQLTEEQKYKVIKAFCKYITVFYTVHENVIELALFTANIYQFIRDDTVA